jgi:uncharacterized protein YjgD (DUF1641 family)
MSEKLKKEIEELNNILKPLDKLREGEYFDLTIASGIIVRALQKIRDILRLFVTN